MNAAMRLRQTVEYSRRSNGY